MSETTDFIKYRGQLLPLAADLASYPSLAAWKAALSSGTSTVAWTAITGKPTTFAGYGITDAGALASKSTVNDADWLGADLSIANGGTGASTASAALTALGAFPASSAGTAATKNTGTSGNTVPLLDGTNTWSGAQTVSNTVSATRLISTVATGTAPFTVTSTTPVANLVASAASKLATARNINGVAFDGTADIMVPTSGVVTTPASTASTAGLKAPPGTAPTSPGDGDIWTTTAGMYVRIAGVTVGPLAAAGGSLPPGQTWWCFAQDGPGLLNPPSYWRNNTAASRTVDIPYNQGSGGSLSIAKSTSAAPTTFSTVQIGLTGQAGTVTGVVVEPGAYLRFVQVTTNVTAYGAVIPTA